MGKRRRKKLPEGLFRADIESVDQKGRGVAHIDGKATFIFGALAGEQVEFSYSSVQKRYDEGSAVNILKPSDQRVSPGCEHFGLCGGCALQHLSSDAQIDAKQKSLIDAFQRIGKVDSQTILPALTNASVWGYRTKARLGVKHVYKKGKVLVGFRERGTSFVADIEKCPVLSPVVGEHLPDLSALVESLSISQKVPQIEVAIGSNTTILIFRVLESPTENDRAKLASYAENHHVAIYLQTGGPDTVTPLSGVDTPLYYELPEYQLEMNFLPNDFTQVNVEMNKKMLAQAIDLLDIKPEDSVLDLFCGLGNFTLPIARIARHVVGVEGDAGLVQRARDNASKHGIENTQFYTANLYDKLEAEPWLLSSYDKVLLDPPRSGAMEILDEINKLSPQRIVYVSCYPGTLARDAGILVNDYGYTLVSAGVMDMFPHTGHVESIALFEK